MDNKRISLTPYLVTYAEASTQEHYERLFDSLSQLPFDDYLRFIKRTSCYQYKASYNVKIANKARTVTIGHPEHFWDSPLTLRWARELFCSDYAEEFLFGLFSKADNYNKRLVEEIARHNPLQLIRSIKLKKCFLEDALFSKLLFMKLGSNPLLNAFYEEIEAIKRLDEDWQHRKKFYESALDSFSSEEIMVHAVSYFEKFKRSSYSHLNNKYHLISMEVCLISVLNHILNERRRKGIGLQEAFDIPGIYSLISRELPPRNTAEGIANMKYMPVETISDSKKLIREALKFYFSYLHGFLYQLDKYCVGYADVVHISGQQVYMRTNAEYKLSKKDDKKNRFLESYFARLACESTTLQKKNRTATDLNERQQNLMVASYMEQFNFMKIDVVKHKNHEFSPEDLITLLWNFSQWLIPQGRNVTVVPEKETSAGTWVRPEIFTRSMPGAFRKLFPQDYVVAFDYPVLLQSCVQYFGWEESKCEAMLDFLTYHMDDSGIAYTFPEYPLVKIGKNYFWLSSFLRDRQWFNVLTQRFQKAIHREQSKKLETSISQIFREAGFNSVASTNYKDGEVREIDCLAYKDGCLFIVELKTTYPSEDLIRQSEFDSRKLEHKAVNQLENALNYYEADFNFFKEIQGLGIDKDKKDITVYTLIVTNTFERDKELKNMQHLKMSLFELNIALKNDLYRMLNSNYSSLFPEGKGMGDFEIPFHLKDRLNNQNDSTLKNVKLDTSKEACDLYNGRPVSAAGLVRVIREDLVWQLMDKAYEMNVVEQIPLGTFDVNYKWLE